MGVGNTLWQFCIRRCTSQLRFVIGSFDDLYTLLNQTIDAISCLGRKQGTLRNDQCLIVERLIQQGILIHRVVVIAMQRIDPVFQIEDTS